MKKIAFAGSFDIVTKGHLWVVQEGLNLADSVVMMLAQNPSKSSFFTDQEKLETVKNSLIEMGIADRVDVVLVKKEFSALYALNNGCDYMIRGIRSSLDFDAESLIQKANRDVLKGAKTVFVMPPRELESVSSSFVKSLMVAPGWHWAVKEFVTKSVYSYILQKYVRQCIRKYWGYLNNQDTALADQFVEHIMAAYGSHSRFYHGLEHLAHGFQELEWAQANIEGVALNYDAVGLAYCVHDVVYGQGDDEEKSAKWFLDFLGEKSEKVLEIMQLVKATSYSTLNSELSLNSKLLRSIDLSILGQSGAVYDWYSSAVRIEYGSVPDRTYIPARINVLKTLLDQETLFETLEFSRKYEVLARKNLINEIKVLNTLQAD